MLEAIALWKEPHNLSYCLSYWNFHLDPEWKRLSEMVHVSMVQVAMVQVVMVQVVSAATCSVKPQISIVPGYCDFRSCAFCPGDFCLLREQHPLPSVDLESEAGACAS